MPQTNQWEDAATNNAPALAIHGHLNGNAVADRVLFATISVVGGNLLDATFPGWTRKTMEGPLSGGAHSGATYVRVATGTAADNIAPASPITGGAVTSWSINVIERDDIDSTLPARPTNSGNSTTTRSVNTGDVTPVAANDIVLAALTVMNEGQWDSFGLTGVTVTNGFVKGQVSGQSLNVRAATLMASKVISDLSAQSTLFTGQGSGNEECSAHIVVFKAAGAAPADPTITLTLNSAPSTPAANLSGLKWAWFDEVTPDLLNAPTDQGAIETTDGSGEIVITLPNTTLTTGQIGFLIITDSDGVPSTEHSGLFGPLAID